MDRGNNNANSTSTENSKGDVFDRLSKKRTTGDRTEHNESLENLIRRDGFQSDHPSKRIKKGPHQ